MRGSLAAAILSGSQTRSAKKNAANPGRDLRPISVNLSALYCYILESPARMRFTVAAIP